MNKTVPVVIVVAVALVAAGVGVYVLMNNGSSDDYYTPIDAENTPPSQWSYFGGDVGSFGVTDAKTPITKDDMKLAWKFDKAKLDQAGGTWEVPSSAICVEDSVFFYSGMEKTLYRCSVSTGKEIATAKCESSSVYSMALAYGDGKVFICAYDKSNYATVLHAFDANTLEHLFQSVPVSSDEVQGTITYNDGKVYFGTYSGDYACFLTTDTDKDRSDETVKPLWLLKSDGWYNATPAFFDDRIVIVQRGFDDGGVTAYLIDSDTGVVLDTIKFDREYSSSGATAYEGRVYIPLSRVIDRTIDQPKAETPKHLIIYSYEVKDSGFDKTSVKSWESNCAEGSTQSIPVIWNDTIYIGGGGLTTGSDEPFWIIDIAGDGTMSTRASFPDIKTKGTAAITTAYATKENGYAVYIYLMEYGHVQPGEDILSTKGYADIFVIKDSKTEGASVAFTIRPEPEQFCFQSFSISKDGYLLIKNDSTLFCYQPGSEYTASDVSSAISRFVSMNEEGNANYTDYLRIKARYDALDQSGKDAVGNYADLEGACVSLTLKTASGDKVLTVPKGSLVDIPAVSVPNGKIITGWESGGSPWCSFRDCVTADTVLTPVYADACTVRADPDNGDPATTLQVAKGSKLPYIDEPVRSGYRFDGWMTDSEDIYLSGTTVVNSDLDMFAKWVKIITLKFDTDGGSAVKGTYKVEQGKTIGKLPTTLKAGYSFGGWFYDSVEYTKDSTYTYNYAVTLKAHWMENPVITKDNGNGISITGQMPNDAVLSVMDPPSTTASCKSVINEYKKSHPTDNPDSLRLYLVGDGVDPSLTYTVRIDVGTEHNGETYDVCYFDETKSVKVTGTVTDGKLTFDVKGDDESRGEISITFATDPTLGIKDRL